jgi:hypothetical protein
MKEKEIDSVLINFLIMFSLMEVCKFVFIKKKKIIKKDLLFLSNL